MPCLVQNNAALPFFKPECAKDGSCKSGSAYDLAKYASFVETDFPEGISSKNIPAPKEEAEDGAKSENALSNKEDGVGGEENSEEDEEPIEDIIEIGGSREMLFGLFDRNMDQTIEPFEIVMFAGTFCKSPSILLRLLHYYVCYWALFL